MRHFLVCQNAKCHFVFDPRVNGTSKNSAQLILEKCPECGGAWSTACPSSGQALAVKIIAGLPRAICCERKSAKSATA